MLGLWSRHTAEPRPAAPGGGGGIAFADADVDAVHAGWARRVTVLQRPTDMDLGRRFTAVDPDGHRLRVFPPMDG